MPEKEGEVTYDKRLFFNLYPVCKLFQVQEQEEGIHQVCQEVDRREWQEAAGEGL